MKMNDDKLVKNAKKYIAILREFVGELDYSLSEIDRNLNNYLYEHNSKSKIKLLSSIALFEKYFLPLVNDYRNNSSLNNDSNKDTYRIIIDRDWRAYEFRQMFNSIDYFNKIYVLKSKFLDKLTKPHFLRHDEGYFSYRNALLHNYLYFREELSVTQIKYASKGNVNFEGLAEVIRELRETIDWLISAKWLENILINWSLLRDKEYKKLLSDKKRMRLRGDYEHEKNRVFEEKIKRLKARKEIEKYSFLKPAIRIVKEELKSNYPKDYENNIKYFNKLEKLSDIGVELEIKKVASLPQYEQRVIFSAQNLNRLGYKSKKIIPTSEND
jgi:hypothetical protein